jgi:hypothetical protein
MNIHSADKKLSQCMPEAGGSSAIVYVSTSVESLVNCYRVSNLFFSLRPRGDFF